MQKNQARKSECLLRRVGGEVSRLNFDLSGVQCEHCVI